MPTRNDGITLRRAKRKMLTAETERNSARSFAVNALLHAAIVSAKVRFTVVSGPTAERAHGLLHHRPTLCREEEFDCWQDLRIAVAIVGHEIDRSFIKVQPQFQALLRGRLHLSC